jgi:arylformamidase
MKIHDISVTLSPQVPTWPGDPKVVLERFSKMEEGAKVNISRMELGVHTGTHIDAPYHFLADGVKVDSLPLEILIGSAQVVEFPKEVKRITAETLEKAEIPADCRRLLFKTSNSDLWARGEIEFQRDYVGLTNDGAEYLIARGIRLVGMDYLSVAAFDQLTPTHLTLLGAGVVVIESVDLSKVRAGAFTLICLPLKLGGAEGAPARAVLIEE